MKATTQHCSLCFLLFTTVLLCIQHYSVVETRTTRDLLNQKKSMLQNVKDVQTDLLTMMDVAKTLALPSDQTMANQYYQEQQSKLEKTKLIEKTLSFELGLLETKCKTFVGENCNNAIPSNCTTEASHATISSSLFTSVVLPSTINIIGDNDAGRKWSNFEMASSCDQYRNPKEGYVYEGATGDGVYWIKTKTTFKVWCDMSSNGGGWTLIVAQFETDPIGSWAQGLTSTYDPTLQTKKSFVLDQHLIPGHNYTGFGKDLQATTVDYFKFTYTTGDIPVVELVGFKANANYRIHRHSVNYYLAHNPYRAMDTAFTKFRNTLTCSKSYSETSWAFSPYYSAPGAGYAMLGVFTDSTSETYAWTVWVK
ncbi:hypothetical protein ABK040_006076 [Willaertia magna]